MNWLNPLKQFFGESRITKSRPFSNLRKPTFDCLEDRCVPAVDITAFNTAAGTVTFTGDLNGTTSDSLVLSQVAVGSEIRLSHNLIGNGGTGNYADNTDIDPTAGVAHLVLGTGSAPLISVNLGTGNDSFRLANAWAFLHGINVNGGADSDVITGPSTNQTWNVTGAGSGTLGGNVQFAAFERLQGGSAKDTFEISADFGGSIRGGAGDDRFVVHDTLTVATSIVGEAGIDTLDLSDLATPVNVTLSGVTSLGFSGSTTLAAFTGIDEIIGGSDADTLVGLNASTTWDLDGTPTLTTGGMTLAFSSFENLQGGASTDTFIVSTATTVDIDGGAGDDTVIGPNTSQTWSVTGVASGSMSAGVDFAAIERLQGGTAADTFDISANFAGTIHGGAGADQFNIDAGVTAAVTIVGGAGADTLDLSDILTALTVTLTSVNSSGFSGNTALAVFAGINEVIGGQGSDTLVGPNILTVWDLDGTPTLTAGGHTLAFSSFATLQGGSSTDVFFVAADTTADLYGGAGADVFHIAPTATLDGSIRGGGSVDTLSYATFTTDVDVNLNTGVATAVNDGIAGIENVVGGFGDDLLIGNDANNRLVGGAGDDMLFGNGGHDRLSGGFGDDILVGGAGNDVLSGGPGRDILIGGLGADILHGGGGEDILIGGYTSLDNDRNALNGLRAEWVRTDVEYHHRVNQLRQELKDSLFDDDAADRLTGGDDRDWFIIGKEDEMTDRNNPNGERHTRAK